MKLGLIGLPQVGKKTIFKLLTGQKASLDGGKASGLGLAKVRDVRVDRLVEMYHPEKETPAKMEFVLLPDLDTQAEKNEAVFKALEQVDVICYLARVFEDDTVFHMEGDVNARRDIRTFYNELLLADQIFVEKRLERLEKERGWAKDAQRAAMEKALLTRMQEHLEGEKPLSRFDLTKDEKKLINSYPFLTTKAVMVVLNVGEDQIGESGLVEEMKAAFPTQGFEWVEISVQIEQEISQLEAKEREVFLEELGIEQSALDRLTLVCYDTLGLISFFTVGEDEVRAWTIRKGTLAPRAGGAIHGDIEHGFIRAQTVRYEDLIEKGSEQQVKAAGKLVQKGKDAEILDGDVIQFLFKV
ncbi:MAG: DUF933 domain-containing protein [bacterium]|nr:DUF933 domain-containing protein [bacterium]